MNASQKTASAPPMSELQVLKMAVGKIDQTLPPLLKAHFEIEETNIVAGNPQYDAILKFSIFQGRYAQFGVEIKHSFEMRDLIQSVARLRAAGSGQERNPTNPSKTKRTLKPMMVARYLSKPAQEFLKSVNISYADATGNFMIVSLESGFFYESDKGAASDPWRALGRPSGSLKGKAAAKIVRALIDELPGLTMPALIRLANSSSSTAYRVVEYLESQAMLERAGSRITEVSWKSLIRRWSTEYSYWKENSVIGFLDPRGIDSILKKLKFESDQDYAITGSVAGALNAPYAQAKQLTMYGKYPNDLAKSLGLRPVDTGANVFIAATAYDVVFERTRVVSGLNYVGLSQVAVDLLSGPGRNPEEAQALLEWMEKNENRWRTNT